MLPIPAVDDEVDARDGLHSGRAVVVPPSLGRRTVVALAWSVAIFVVLFWQLGKPTLWDPDEAYYAEGTRELITTGDWFAPFYNEQPFFDKPILFYWAQAAPMALLGPTETAARLPSAIAALAVTVATAWFARRLLTTDVATMAALLVATSPGVFALARYAILDTLFTAFTFGGAAFLTIAALRERPRLQYVGYGFLGLGVLTKGPLAIVLAGLSMLLASALSADARRRLFGLRWFLGLLIIVAIAAPWFVYMTLRFRGAFLHWYFLDENALLFAHNRFGKGAGATPWFYFQVLAAGLLPWTGLVVGRFVDWIRALARRDGSTDTLDTLLWSWTVAIVGFFSLSSFKLDHYIFPATPAIAILCARGWHDLRVRPHDEALAWSRAGLQTVGPLFVTVGVGAGVFMIARLALPWMAAIAPISIAAAGALVTARGTLLHWIPSRHVPVFIPAAMVVTYASIVAFVMPALEARKVVPSLAVQTASVAQPGDAVASFRLNRWNPAFRFYVGRHVQMIDDPNEAARMFRGSQRVYCVMLRPAYEEFVAAGLPLRIVAARAGMWATSGRPLWRRRIPPTEYLLVSNR